MPPRSKMLAAASAVRTFPPSTFTTRTRASSSTKAMDFPSGDHVTSQANFDSPMEMRRGSPIPSWAPMRS